MDEEKIKEDIMAIIDYQKCKKQASNKEKNVPIVVMKLVLLVVGVTVPYSDFRFR